MTSRLFILFSVCLVMVLLVSGLVAGARVQGAAEDVHVTPRQPATVKHYQPVEDSSLKTDITHIKVDVNLVLVSVSIVDPLDRQVTGLDKQNFEVFEGKERQEIKHFSTEDAPISVGAVFDVSGSIANQLPGSYRRTSSRSLESMSIARPRIFAQLSKILE